LLLKNGLKKTKEYIFFTLTWPHACLFLNMVVSATFQIGLDALVLLLRSVAHRTLVKGAILSLHVPQSPVS
jgi:hypothetical protein